MNCGNFATSKTVITRRSRGIVFLISSIAQSLPHPPGVADFVGACTAIWIASPKRLSRNFIESKRHYYLGNFACTPGGRTHALRSTEPCPDSFPRVSILFTQSQLVFRIRRPHRPLVALDGDVGLDQPRAWSNMVSRQCPYALGLQFTLITVEG